MNQLVRLNKSILSPLVLFPVLWVLAALLSQIHLLNVQTPWSTTMTAVVVCVPVAFIAGGVIGSGLGMLTRHDLTGIVGRPSERTVRLLMLVFVAIGYAELAHQFVKIGGIPLIAEDGNTIRFLQGGPTVVLINFLTIAGLVAFVRPENLLSRKAWFELGIAAICMAGFALQAGRGSLALMIVVAVVARWLYWGRPRTWLIFGSGLAAFVILVFGFYLRTRNVPSEPFEAELFGEVLPGIPFILKPLIPVYLAVVTNFYALQGLVAEFPNATAFGHGAYNSIGLDLFIPGTLNVSTLSGLITPPWITSTVAGPLWADWGFPAVIIGVAATGIISMGAFTMARRTRNLGWCLVAGYLLYVTIFGLYTNLWTQQIDWMMVSPFLLLLGFACDRNRQPESHGEVEVTTIDNVSDEPEETDGPEESGGRAPAKTWILLGIGALLVLIIAGLFVQRLLPKPIPVEGTNSLPVASVTAKTQFMTNGDSPTDNEPLTWITPGAGRTAEAFVRPPLVDGPGARFMKIEVADPDETVFDISTWPPALGPAIFGMTQKPGWLEVSLNHRSPKEVPAQTFRAPVREPRGEQRNDYSIATWTGPMPDLFVFTRGSNIDRVRLQILSGESGFRKSIFNSRLPFIGLQPDLWSIDFGTISRGLESDDAERPDLLMIRHDPDKELVDIQLARGENDFTEITYQRDIDVPGDIGRDTDFLISFYSTWPSLDVVSEVDGDPANREVSVVGLAPLALSP